MERIARYATRKGEGSQGYLLERKRGQIFKAWVRGNDIVERKLVVFALSHLTI